MGASHKKIIVGVVGLILLIGAFILVREFNRIARDTQAYSAQEALKTELFVLLMQYFEEHDSYPQSLSNLPIAYSDGANKELLDKFDYHNEGKSCFFEYPHKNIDGKETGLVRWLFTEGKFPKTVEQK